MKMVTNGCPTTDGVEIIHREFFEGKPEMMDLLEEERANSEIARLIYKLRTDAGLTPEGLAKRTGITASTIRCLEDADYEGDFFAMLRRIAAALSYRVDLHLLPIPQEQPELHQVISGTSLGGFPVQESVSHSGRQGS